MNTGWNLYLEQPDTKSIINLLGNEYWLELAVTALPRVTHYKPTGK